MLDENVCKIKGKMKKVIKSEEHYVQIEEMFKTENEFCPFPVLIDL